MFSMPDETSPWDRLLSEEATLNRGSIDIAPALADPLKATTGKRWQDAEPIWSIWMMASQDPTSFLSYQSVASRLYGPIKEGKELTAKVLQVRDLVGRWRELFRLNASPGDFKNWKHKVDENFKLVQKKQNPDSIYPEWLLDLSVEDQEVQLATLQNDVFRSQFRVGQDREKSSPEQIKFGMDYIDSMRSALLDADKENRANILERERNQREADKEERDNRLEREREAREAEKHRRDRWLVFLAVLALLVPASVTAWTSYETHEQSVRANDLKEVENKLREAEIKLRTEENQSHDAEIRDRNLATAKDTDARFVGLLSKVYAAWLNADKNECVTLTGDLDSAFSTLANTKSNSVRLEHRGIRQLCIDTLTGIANIAERRSQAEQMIERARTVLGQ
jgi:hypothetical protein